MMTAMVVHVSSLNVGHLPSRTRSRDLEDILSKYGRLVVRPSIVLYRLFVFSTLNSIY
jgi:hypothetical protein